MRQRSSHCVFTAALAVAATGFIPPHAVAAEPYPARPLRLVVPFAPGGGSDVIGRIIGQDLSRLFGQSVVVDNRPGAASMLGTDLVARAAPDGYTLLLADMALAINSAYFAKQSPPDPVKSFVAVAMIVETPYILLVHPGVAANDVRSLISLAKAKPGALGIGSSGNGGGPHMTLELFKLRAGLDLNHIPYKGGGPATNDLLAGRIQGAFIGMGASLAHIQNGWLRPLAVTSTTRSRSLPEVPTMTEAGIDVVVNNWYGIVAPAATPRPVVQRLYDTVGKAVGSPEVIERLKAMGFEPAAQSPGQFQRRIESDLDLWRRMIRDARIPTG